MIDPESSKGAPHRSIVGQDQRAPSGHAPLQETADSTPSTFYSYASPSGSSVLSLTGLRARASAPAPSIVLGLPCS